MATTQPRRELRRDRRRVSAAALDAARREADELHAERYSRCAWCRGRVVDGACIDCGQGEAVV